jgi:hypothetical protein
MSANFEGWVIAPTRVASVNAVFSGEAQLLVRAQDRAQYTLDVLQNPQASEAEYLCRVVASNNLVVPALVSEEATPLTPLTYQFNTAGIHLETGSVSASPLPDSIDEEAGVLTYLSTPITTPQVTYTPLPLALEYTRNDPSRTRFGYNATQDLWYPLPGTTPWEITDISALLTVPFVETTPPRLLLGSPRESDAFRVPLNLQVNDADFATYRDGNTPVPTGEGVWNRDTGEVVLASDLSTTYAGQSAYATQESFPSSTSGLLGTVGEELFMNPIPLIQERPLCRIDFNTYLEAEVSAVDTGQDVRIDPVSGEVFLSSALLIASQGQAFYYDGVCIGEVVFPRPTAVVGTLGGALASIDLQEYEAPLLYLESSGRTLDTLTFVSTSADFTAPRKLGEGQVEIARDTGDVNVSRRLEASAQGETLRVGCGDYALERGLTLRVAQSPLDRSNTQGIPDGVGRIRLVDQVLESSVKLGPSVSIAQVPLTDLAGYTTESFFVWEKEGRRTILKPNVDIVEDFENRQLLWTQPESYQTLVGSADYEVALPHQVLIEPEFSFELNEGQGFSTQVPGQDIEVNFDTGIVQFTEKVGGVQAVYRGTATPTGYDFGVQDLTPLTPSTDQPLILELGEAQFLTTSKVGSLLTTTPPPGLDGDVTIYDTPELVYRTALDTLTLTAPALRAFRRQDVLLATDLRVPSCASLEIEQAGAIVPVVRLEPSVIGTLGNVLSLPVELQHPEAQYRVLRDGTFLTQVVGVPNSDEFRIIGADFEFNTQDETTFAGVEIQILPELSSTRASGSVEWLVSEARLGVPTSVSGSATLLCEVPQEDLTLTGALLYLRKPLSPGQRLEVRYTSGGVTYQELVSFTRNERVVSPYASTTYGVGFTLDASRTPQVRVNGVTQEFRGDAATGLLLLPEVSAAKQVTVTYGYLEATGSEQQVALPRTPEAEPVLFSLSTTQSFTGDHTSVLSMGTFIQADTFAAEVISAPNFDGVSTQVQLSNAPSDVLRDPVVWGSGVPVTYQGVQNLEALDTPQGVQELQLAGDLTGQITLQRIIRINSTPYYVSDVSYQEGTTTLTLGSATVSAYTGTISVEISEDVAYAPGAGVLQVSQVGLDGSDFALYRRDLSGITQVDPQAYRYEVAGRITLDPTQIELPRAGEIWYFRYTALRVIGPTTINGAVFFPRVRAQYTRRINATPETYQGGTLRGTYTLRHPDSFYARLVTLETYAQEEAERIQAAIEATTSGQGALLNVSSSEALNTRGTLTVEGEGHLLLAQDRVARRYLSFYQDVISNFEALQEVIDGRSIGDSDGKFSFALRNEDTPGGEDSVTGELLPYYINASSPGVKPNASELESINLEAQVQRSVNHLDDIITVSKKPFELVLGFPPALEFQGTFKALWEPSRFSRVYPERLQAGTLTVPSLSGGGTYTFLDDFNQLLADIGQDGVLSVIASPRYGAAYAVSSQEAGATLIIEARQSYDASTGTLTNSPYDMLAGDPDQARPPFKVGDHVDIGRVLYTSGTAERVNVASDLVVVQVTSTSITVEEGNGTALGTFAIRIGDTIYGRPSTDVSGVADLAGLDPLDMPFYRTPLDIRLDTSEGELLNPTLPSFLSGVLGQKTPPPLTYLDVDATYKNRRISPVRFPALDGSFLNDDGLRVPPYAAPLQDSELQRLPGELEALTSVLATDASVALDAGTSPAPNRIQTVLDGSLLGGQLFDYVTLEGVLNTSNLADIGTNVIDLAAFSYRDSSLSYELSSLATGSGTVAGAVLTDVSTDFTVFSGGTLTLHLGTSSYAVISTANGSLTLSSAPVETGVQAWRLSVQGIGAVNADLRGFSDAGIDFSLATGTLTYDREGQTVIEPLVVGDATTLYPLKVPQSFTGQVTFTPSNTLLSGTGSVEGTSFYTASSLGAIQSGDVLILDSTSPNAGRYRILTVEADHLTLDGGADTSVWETSFYVDEGDHTTPTYPVIFRIQRPRRHSSQLQNLQEEWARQRVLYASSASAPIDIQPFLTGITTSNPSAPYQEALDALDGLLFTAIGTAITGTATATQTLTGPDFELLGVRIGDHVRIALGVNSGFYFVTDVSGTSLTVDGDSDFASFTLSAQAETFTVYAQSRFTLRTESLVLSEIYSQAQRLSRIDQGIRSSVTDYVTLGTQPFEVLWGAPTDVTLNAHSQAVTARLALIRDAAPTLSEQVEGILAGDELLYDQRWSWLVSRCHQAEGLLVQYQRYLESRQERKDKLERDLRRLQGL